MGRSFGSENCVSLYPVIVREECQHYIADIIALPGYKLSNYYITLSQRVDIALDNWTLQIKSLTTDPKPVSFSFWLIHLVIMDLLS